MTEHGRHNARKGTPAPTDPADDQAATDDVAVDSDQDSLPDGVQESGVDGNPLGDHRSFFDSDIPVGDEPLR